jgi:hypothetical protein
LERLVDLKQRQFGCAHRKMSSEIASKLSKTTLGMEEYPRMYHSRHHYAAAHRNTSHKQPIRAAVLRKPASPLKMEQLKLKARVMMKTHPPATERNLGGEEKLKN